MTTRLLCRQRDVAKDEQGFTLLEVVVSFTLFVIVAAASLTAILSAIKASHRSQQRVTAANVAQSFIASTQANTATAKPETDAAYEAAVKGEQFTVRRTITFAGAATQCSPGVSFTVNVVVFQKQTNYELARSDSVITC